MLHKATNVFRARAAHTVRLVALNVIHVPLGITGKLPRLHASRAHQGLPPTGGQRSASLAQQDGPIVPLNAQLGTTFTIFPTGWSASNAHLVLFPLLDRLNALNAILDILPPMRLHLFVKVVRLAPTPIIPLLALPVRPVHSLRQMQQ